MASDTPTAFEIDDLVKLKTGTPEELEAVWIIEQKLNATDVILKKIRGSDQLPERRSEKMGNLRMLTDEELKSITGWRRGNFARVTRKGLSYAGKIVGFVGGAARGVVAIVELIAICGGEGGDGFSTNFMDRLTMHKIEVDLLRKFERRQVEWLEVH